MLWPDFSQGLFGFLRAGEFTCPSQAALSSEMLMVGDVVIDSHENPHDDTFEAIKDGPFWGGVHTAFWSHRQ